MVLRVLEGLLLSMDEGLTIIKGVIRDHILLQIAVFGLEIRFIYSSLVANCTIRRAVSRN